ncbi:MAG: CrcB family protein [Nocardioides sp.]
MTRPSPTPGMLGAVAAGGALGAVLRDLLGRVSADGAGFPWTTFAINVGGSLLLALLPASAGVRKRPLLVLALGPGLLGGFTTLSAYAEQGRALLADGQPLLAGTYLLGTLAACLAAVAVADRLSTAADRVEFEDEEGDE